MLLLLFFFPCLSRDSTKKRDAQLLLLFNGQRLKWFSPILLPLCLKGDGRNKSLACFWLYHMAGSARFLLAQTFCNIENCWLLDFDWCRNKNGGRSVYVAASVCVRVCMCWLVFVLSVNLFIVSYFAGARACDILMSKTMEYGTERLDLLYAQLWCHSMPHTIFVWNFESAGRVKAMRMNANLNENGMIDLFSVAYHI